MLFYRHFRAITLLAAILCVWPPLSFAREKTFGLRGGYVSRNQSGLAGLCLTYRVNNYFRLAPSANYIFRHHGRDAFTLAADGQFLFDIPASSVTIYPIAGISYWVWNIRNLPSGIRPEPDASFNDVTTRHSRFALDFGAGWQYKVSSTMSLTINVSYSLMHHTPSWISTAGISYIF